MFDVLGGLTLSEKDEISSVVRVVLKFEYASGVASSHVYGAFGLIIAGDQAISSGSASIPDPNTRGDQGWMHLGRFSTQDTAFREANYDVRVGRRLPTGFSLAFKLQTDVGQDVNVHWSTFMRILLRHR